MPTRPDHLKLYESDRTQVIGDAESVEELALAASCYHEAAHFIVANALNMHGAVPMLDTRGGHIRIRETDSSQSAAMVFAAGIVGEDMYLDSADPAVVEQYGQQFMEHHDDCTDEYHLAVKWFCSSGHRRLTEDERDAAWEVLRARARSLLRRLWSQVVLIARKLHEGSGNLTEQECVLLLEPQVGAIDAGSN